MTPEERPVSRLIYSQTVRLDVQDRSQINLALGPGVAIREATSKTGEADYLLFPGGKAIVTVEAKPEKNVPDVITMKALREATKHVPLSLIIPQV
jgi:type I site-specific restriction endonuclease